MVLTWSRSLRQLPPSKPTVGVTLHEVGIGAEIFDDSLLVRLIRASAVESVCVSAESVVAEAQAILAGVPTGRLYGGTERAKLSVT